LKAETAVANWHHLKESFSHDFQQKIEREWQKPFSEVFSFLSGRTKTQLRNIALFDDLPAPQFLTQKILSLAEA
jgi:hypothetical protein